MKPIVVTGGPWPERHGQKGWDVTEMMNRRFYPRAGLGKREVIILIHEDPLKATMLDREHATAWTCVLNRSDVEYV